VNPYDLLQTPRKLALWIISIVVALATVVSFVESYRALYIWATHHEVIGISAAIWPLMIDSFILVGELTLFVGMVDRWNSRARIFPWAVTLAGLAVSVAGNVGHVQTHDFWTRATAAVAPIAAAASLTVGMGVLKRVVRLHHSTRLLPLGTDVEVLPGSPELSLDELTADSRPHMSTNSTDDAGGGSGPGDADPKERRWSRERKARHIVKHNPEISGGELGRRLGVSERHGQRVRQKVANSQGM
jgi:Protein of unknown function (DUF2637)